MLGVQSRTRSHGDRFNMDMQRAQSRQNTSSGGYAGSLSPCVVRPSWQRVNVRLRLGILLAAEALLWKHVPDTSAVQARQISSNKQELNPCALQPKLPRRSSPHTCDTTSGAVNLGCILYRQDRVFDLVSAGAPLDSKPSAFAFTADWSEFGGVGAPREAPAWHNWIMSGSFCPCRRQGQIVLQCDVTGVGFG
jgi:hypothetical protein